VYVVEVGDARSRLVVGVGDRQTDRQRANIICVIIGLPADLSVA